MRCTKVIIPVAGYGTRRLPITKAIEKCMLPIVDRPIIDYIVEDCIKAGITDIYLVISEGATQVRDYYGHNRELEQYLQAKGKEEMLSSIQPPEGIRFHFVEQPTSADQPYGTSVPVLLCREFLEADEHVLVLAGDDFIFNADGSSEVRRLLDAAEKTGGSAMLAAEIPQEEVSRYGVVVAHRDESGLRFDHIQEKPTVAEAKSNLINISKYVFDGRFFQEYLALDTVTNGEYYITDPINAYVAAGNSMYVVPIQGQYLDGGTAQNWHHANEVVLRAMTSDTQ